MSAFYNLLKDNVKQKPYFTLYLLYEIKEHIKKFFHINKGTCTFIRDKEVKDTEITTNWDL